MENASVFDFQLSPEDMEALVGHTRQYYDHGNIIVINIIVIAVLYSFTFSPHRKA